MNQNLITKFLIPYLNAMRVIHPLAVKFSITNFSGWTEILPCILFGMTDLIRKTNEMC